MDISCVDTVRAGYPFEKCWKSCRCCDASIDLMDLAHGLGNVTGEVMLNTLLNHWIENYGKANSASTGPEEAFRDEGVRRVSCCEKKFELTLMVARRLERSNVLGKTPNTIKQSAIRVARKPPDSVTVQKIFDETHNSAHIVNMNRGFFRGGHSSFIHATFCLPACLVVRFANDMRYDDAVLVNDLIQRPCQRQKCQSTRLKDTCIACCTGVNDTMVLYLTVLSCQPTDGTCIRHTSQ